MNNKFQIAFTQPSVKRIYEQWKRVILPQIGYDCHYSLHHYMASLLSSGDDDKLALQFHMLAVICKEKTLQTYYAPSFNEKDYYEWISNVNSDINSFLSSAYNVYDIRDRMEQIVNKHITHHAFFGIKNSNSYNT